MGKVVRRGPVARKLAIEIVKNGGSYKEAAEKTGYGVDYVRQICVKAKVSKTVFQIHAEKADFIRHLVSQGKAPKEIAEATGFSLTSVYSICHEYGIDFLEKKRIKKGKKEEARRRVTRICERCGTAFDCYAYSNQRFCTVRCSEAAYHERHDIERRRLKKKAKVDNDITLKRVFQKDKGICYICGKPCNFESYIIENGKKCVCGEYPSIDHVVPLSKGGLHVWNNVRLAHIGCNSRKGAS